MTLTVRRGAVALALASALALSACGTEQPGRAAVVSGSVITESDVYALVDDVNRTDPAIIANGLTPADAVTQLIRTDIALDYFRERGIDISQDAATALMAQYGVSDPSPATISFVQFNLALNEANASGGFGPAEQAELTDRLAEAEIEVNPRFGTFSPDTASVTSADPDWIGIPTQ